ncbi:MAG: helix-turn-helix domain-containing protein, partial [bacterium]
MQELGQRIRKLREVKSLSQSEIEKRTGLKREYLSKIENGDLKNPTYSTLSRLSDGLEVRIGELVDPAEFMKPRVAPVLKIVSSNVRRDKQLERQANVGGYVSVPILESAIAAGNPIHIDEKDIRDYTLIHSSCLAHTTDYNRYRCVWIKKGSESMYPVLRSGSLICIDAHQRDPHELNGSIVAIKDEEGGCTVRNLKIYNNNIVAIPENLDGY